MRHVPQRLRSALRIVFEGHDVELDPIARRVTIRTPDVSTTRHRIGFYDGFRPPLVIGTVDRTSDVIRALSPVFDAASAVVDSYGNAAHVALRRETDLRSRLTLPYVEAIATMRAYARALEELETWLHFHTVLAEQGASDEVDPPSIEHEADG